MTRLRATLQECIEANREFVDALEAMSLNSQMLCEHLRRLNERLEEK